MRRTSLDWLTRMKSTGPVLLDGGTGSLLVERTGQKAQVSPLFNLTYPNLVLKAHKEFIAAGARVILVNSFCASRPHLESAGYAGRLHEINTKAVTLARQAIQETAAKNVLVAGSVAPLPPGLSAVAEDDAFREQIDTILGEGVDLIVCETFLSIDQGLLAAKIAREVMIERCLDRPVVLSVVPKGESFQSIDWRIVGRALEAGLIDILGVNCGDGTASVGMALQSIENKAPGPFWVKPSAGLPSLRQDDRLDYPLRPEQFASEVTDLVKSFPIMAAGGCCGIMPEHIDCLGRSLAKLFEESSCTNGSVRSS